MNGNGGLTETENVIFLRKLRCSYGILTDERNFYVLLQRTTAIRKRRNGYVMMETTRPCTRYASYTKNAAAEWSRDEAVVAMRLRGTVACLVFRRVYCDNVSITVI